MLEGVVMRSTLLSLLFVVGCAQAADTKPAPAAPAPEAPATGPLAVAVRVNGRPITEAEVALRMNERGPGKAKLTRDEALERVIELELQAQAAEGMGADKETSFLADMALLQAKVNDARRTALAKSYRMRSVDGLPPPSEAEVQAYLTEHEARLDVELKLRRVRARTRADAEAALAAVRAGKPFDEVAHEFPGETFDVGPLGFDTIPDQWWRALEGVEPPGFAEVVPMGEGRFEVLQLLERKKVPRPAPEELARRAAAVLHAQAFEARRIAQAEQMRKAARVEIPGRAH